MARVRSSAEGSPSSGKHSVAPTRGLCSGSVNPPGAGATGTAAAIAIGSTLTALLLVRAQSLSFTHDESLTYLHGVRPGLERLLAFSYVDANNHLLNTLLAWLSSLAFGNGELALRLPNVAAFVLFFTAVFLLLRRRVRPALVVPGLLLLTCNPFQLDFFALCRGYGLGLGFMAASLYFASRSLEQADGGGPGSRRGRRNAQRAGWFAVCATLANLTAHVMQETKARQTAS